MSQACSFTSSRIAVQEQKGTGEELHTRNAGKENGHCRASHIVWRLKFEIEKEKFQNVAMQNIQIPIFSNQLARLHILKKHYNHSHLRSILDASNYKAYKFASYGQRRQLLENLGDLTKYTEPYDADHQPRLSNQ